MDRCNWCKMYGRRVLKWITQRALLTFVLVKLLVFAPLFNDPKKHVSNYFALEMASFVVGRKRHRREQRARVRRKDFYTLIYLFGMPEENIIRTYPYANLCCTNVLIYDSNVF